MTAQLVAELLCLITPNRKNKRERKIEKPSRCRAGLTTLAMVSIQKKANKKSMYYTNLYVTKMATADQLALNGQLIDGGAQ